MANRPYFKSSINELEKLVEENNSNVDLLEKVQEELSHRKSMRAKGLRLIVKEQLSGDNGSGLTDSYGSGQDKKSSSKNTHKI